MNPIHTPHWLRRRGLTLTPLGELVYIAGAALLAIAWITLVILGTIALLAGLGGQ